VFALWNPPLGVLLMAVYGLTVNAPFILIQRYNRTRAQRLLRRRAAR
jgi:glycosyl-4,4'-diaponeurosporenoate acyltransferase